MILDCSFEKNPRTNRVKRGPAVDGIRTVGPPGTVGWN